MVGLAMREATTRVALLEAPSMRWTRQCCHPAAPPTTSSILPQALLGVLMQPNSSTDPPRGPCPQNPRAICIQLMGLEIAGLGTLQVCSGWQGKAAEPYIDKVKGLLTALAERCPCALSSASMARIVARLCLGGGLQVLCRLRIPFTQQLHTYSPVIFSFASSVPSIIAIITLLM